MAPKALSADEQLLRAAQRALAVRKAKDDLLEFLKLLMPDADDPADATKTRFDVTPVSELLVDIIQRVDSGKLKRAAVSIAPQHGKSQILSRASIAWISGRNPYANIMLGAYNQTFAEEFGQDVRDIMASPFYRQVFPNHALKKGGEAKDLLITEQGGKIAFVGVGGSGTGKPADYFFVDDPIRNDEDAQSAAYREKLWKWFNAVAFSRCHGKSAIVVVMTRWNQDDLIGRLADPEHPEREKLYAGIAKRWTYINLPCVIHDEKLAKTLGLPLEKPTEPDVIDAFGDAPVTALWPQRHPLAKLAEAKQMDARVFGALYMGQPAPEDGEYFKSEWLVEYERDDLPKNLRVYGASDHAVSEKQGRDYTVLGCVGIDERDNIWVLPDLTWARMATDRTVEEMLAKFRIHKPMAWWMESELISKSFGPFLRKRMEEERIYTMIDPVTVSKDKQTRARAIQGRMAMKKVRFPAFAPWWPDARGQLLRFPFTANDDFVDWMSHIGMGLTKELRASPVSDSSATISDVGSIGWMVRRVHERATKGKREAANVGW